MLATQKKSKQRSIEQGTRPKRLEKNLKAGKLTKNNINNQGYNEYLKMEVEIKIDIDYDKFKNDSIWDGLKGYITNTTLTGTEVFDN